MTDELAIADVDKFAREAAPLMSAVACFSARMTSPKQHWPDGFSTSQRQLPAFTSDRMRVEAEDRPVR
jgi:hypothetical protein